MTLVELCEAARRATNRERRISDWIAEQFGRLLTSRGAVFVLAVPLALLMYPMIRS